MKAADLAAADGLAAATAWLSSHEDVTAVLGGPGRVGPYNEPPYPRLVLSQPPGGSDLGLRWLLESVVMLEVWGDRDGSQSPHGLRRMLYVALGALTELPETQVEPGQPVVTAVRGRAGGGWAPVREQPRWLATVALSVHPPVRTLPTAP